MTDQPERHGETEEIEDDFEGHRNADPERHGDISRNADPARHGDIAATDDTEADFEGHRHLGPDRNARHG